MIYVLVSSIRTIKGGKDHAGNVYQWVDCELCMILDIVTGQPQPFGPSGNNIGTFEEAKEYEFRSPQGPSRNVIVRFDAVKSFKIEKGEEQ